jgi:predicted outer membrane repeat protein
MGKHAKNQVSGSDNARQLQSRRRQQATTVQGEQRRFRYGEAVTSAHFGSFWHRKGFWITLVIVLELMSQTALAVEQKNEQQEESFKRARRRNKKSRGEQMAIPTTVASGYRNATRLIQQHFGREADGVVQGCRERWPAILPQREAYRRKRKSTRQSFNDRRARNSSNLMTSLTRSQAAMRKSEACDLDIVPPYPATNATQLYVVNSTADTGPGSLRWAVAQANEHPGPDCVTFSPLINHQNISVTSAPIAITDSLHVAGNQANATVINGHHQVPQFFTVSATNVAHLHFTHMALYEGGFLRNSVSGGAIYVPDSEESVYVKVENCFFHDNVASQRQLNEAVFGGALYLGENTVSLIQGNVFQLNKVVPLPLFVQAGSAGGGIYSAGTMVIANNIFRQHGISYAFDGSAIYIEGRPQAIAVCNNQFYNNSLICPRSEKVSSVVYVSSPSSQLQIAIHDNLFKANGAECKRISRQGLQTLVINAPAAHVVMAGGVFDSNKYLAVSIVSQNTYIYNTSFINNFYGAVACYGVEAKIDNCEFKNNESRVQAILASAANVTHISRVMFKSNRKVDDWSCINLAGRLSYASQLMVSDNICSRVLSVHGDSSECYLTDSIFQDNISTGGGGVTVLGTVHVKNTLFKRNYAKHGAGINIDGGKAYLQNTTFIDNVAVYKGGAIYIDFVLSPSPTQLLFMNGTVLYGNTAGNAGGGIFCSGLNPGSVILNSEFRNNHIVDNRVVIGHGRHLYVDSDSVITIKDSAFYGSNNLDSDAADIYAFFSNNITYEQVYHYGIKATWQHSSGTYTGCNLSNSFFDLELTEIAVENSFLEHMSISPYSSQMGVRDSIVTSSIKFGGLDRFEPKKSKAAFQNTVFNMTRISHGTSLQGVIELTNVSMIGGRFDFRASDVLIDNCQFINVSNLDSLILISYSNLVLKNIELANAPTFLTIHRDYTFSPSEDGRSNSSVTILDSHIVQSLDDAIYIMHDDFLRANAVRLLLENTVIISGKKNGIVIKDSSVDVLITIKSSLLSGNAGSAILVEAGNEPVSIDLYYSTVTANCGGVLAANATGTTLSSRGSYITGNTNARCYSKPLLTNRTLADISGNFDSRGYNVIGSCHQRLLSTDKCANDPRQIMWKGNKVYVSGPSAINTGDPYDYPPTDIIGVPRPQGRAPDAGAHESRGKNSWVVFGLLIATPVVIFGGHALHTLYRYRQVRWRLNILRGKAPWCHHDVLENAQVFRFQQLRGACHYRILDKMAGSSSLAFASTLELRSVNNVSDDDDDSDGETNLLLSHQGHRPLRQYGTGSSSTFSAKKALQDTADHRYWRVRLHEMIKGGMTEQRDAGMNADAIVMHVLNIQKILDALQQHVDYDRRLHERVEVLLSTIKPAQELLLEGIRLADAVTPLLPCFDELYGVALACAQQAQRVRRRNNLSLRSVLRKSYDELSREIDAVQRYYGDFVHDICLAMSKKDAKALSILCAKRAVILCENKAEARYLTVAATLGYDGESEEGILSDRDEVGRMCRSNAHLGSHPVRHVEGIYFKHFLQLEQGESDPNPGFEFMVDSMNKSILNEHVTSASLLVKVFDTGHTYVAQASYGITGRLLADVLTKTSTVIEETKRLNQRNFSAMCISGMLSNPTDGTSMNYMLHEYNAQLFIVGIDNDKAFIPNRVMLGRTREGRVKANVRNIVWLLPQMLAPVDAGFACAFCASSLEALMLEWLDSLQEQNARYDQFLSQSEQRALRLPIRFYSGVVEEVYQKLLKIRELLSNSLSTGKPVLHIDLLSHLLPKLGPAYNDSLRKTYETGEHESPLAAARELNQIPQPRLLHTSISFFNRVDLPLSQEMITVTQALHDFIANIDFPRATLELQMKLLDKVRIIHYKGENLTINHCAALTNKGLPKMLNNKPNIKRLILRECSNIADPQASLLVRNRNESVSVEIVFAQVPSFWQPSANADVTPEASSSQAQAQQSEQLGEHLLIQVDVDQYNDKLVTLRVLNFRQIPLAQQPLLNAAMKAACEKESYVGQAISEHLITKVELSCETDAREVLCRLSGVLELEAVSELLPAATMPRVAI